MRCLFLVFIIKGVTSLCVFSQNNVDGKWEPQYYDETCWQAAIANVSNSYWNQRLKIDSTLQSKSDALNFSVDIDEFENFINPNIKYRKLSNDSVLSYRAINHYLRYQYNRPIIISYNYENQEDEGLGHFVNIIGCDTTNLPSPNKYWLKIYDPKPDSLGSLYFKNYEAYRRRLMPQSDLNATFFNFVNKRFEFPALLRDTQNKRIDREPALFSGNCSSCVNERNFTKEKLKAILTNSAFFGVAGPTVRFKSTWKIPIYDLNNPIELTDALLTVKNMPNSYLAISYDQDLNVKTGTVLAKLKNNKLLIERVEDIGKYQNIAWVFLKPKAKLLVIKGNFRMISFEESMGSSKKKQIFWADLDNLFGQNKPNQTEIYKGGKAIEKLKAYYFKMSDSGIKLLDAFNKLLENSFETCKSGTEKSILADIPIAELRDKFEQELALPFGRFPIRITTSENERRFKMTWDSDWLKNDSIISCTETFPKLKNYQDQDAFFNGNKYGGDYIYIVPIRNFQTFQNSNSTQSHLDLNLLKENLALKISDIKRIGQARMEVQKAFLGKHFKNNFESNLSPVGLVVDVILKNNEIEHCYLFNNVIAEGIPMASQYAWKKY
jgi:hypothetical protein